MKPLTFLLTLLLILSLGTSGQAQESPEEDREERENPLEFTEPDPLLRPAIEQRPLSTLEKRRLEENLDDLALQAAQEWEKDNPEEAFDIWYRELRLRRYLGPVAEVNALGRVGKVAWESERQADLTVIRNRLEAIQTEAEEEETLEKPLYWALGKAYEKIRLYPNALAMYELILADVRQTRNINQLESTLKTIAGLHLGWFKYADAASVYEELLLIARSQYNDAAIMDYLEQLAYIYDQMVEPEKAIQTRQQLLERYQKKALIAQIPPLKIAIAENYETIGEVETANLTYQEAFSLAWENQQFGYASTALKQLAALYYEYNQPDYALEIYQEQLKAAQYAYDFYTMMETYEKMGDIYVELEDYQRALIAYQEGLTLAERLDYAQYEFQEKIDLVSRFL
ncbi:tetratricopeptide repeat protein [Spirulina sp. CS-785/01]|uniref:tetratricopeptide repeat protein n=1 Tax=Spirulina sp. CS-785/01 TaxID=3021716 RepID=UPI00232F71CA|nr:tetratricopeptide repeat protein [Spirulina sp. CS-785/01]MDB9312145.1 tetratricopeptide repeat protein [Spirulina sp. CS-785/01]